MLDGKLMSEVRSVPSTARAVIGQSTCFKRHSHGYRLKRGQALPIRRPFAEQATCSHVRRYSARS